MTLSTNSGLMTLYDHILTIWEGETPDNFDIHSELYYQMFSEIYEEEEE